VHVDQGEEQRCLASCWGCGYWIDARRGNTASAERWRKRAADRSNARAAGGHEETKGRCAAGRQGRELSLAQAVRMGRGLGRTSEIVRKTVGTGEDGVSD
jgi:hypothetical protein